MLIIGCDFHPGFQQVAIFDNFNRRDNGEAVATPGVKRSSFTVQKLRRPGSAGGDGGLQAHYPWFERLLAELGMELWMGDAAKIRAAVVRKQKTDARDAAHLLDFVARENRFPRIWVPSLEVRDVRQLLVHRHKQVQARTRHQEPVASHGIEQRQCSRNASCGAKLGARS